MSASKTLTAAIAAATIVGAVGFVSAQTTSNDPAPAAATSTDPMTNKTDTQAAPPAADNSAAPAADRSMTPMNPAPSTSSPTPSTDSSSTPAPSSSDTSTAPAEPQPKADRN